MTHMRRLTTALTHILLTAVAGALLSAALTQTAPGFGTSESELDPRLSRETVAARRASSLRIHRAETRNRSATCSWVPSPSSTAFRTRSRRSIEYGTITRFLTFTRLRLR